jgi:hypothetical protein
MMSLRFNWGVLTERKRVEVDENQLSASEKEEGGEGLRGRKAEWGGRRERVVEEKKGQFLG